MSKMKNHLLALTVIAGLFSSGCLLQRTIVDLTDHPQKDITLVQTVDVYPFSVKRQFWQCNENAENLTCSKVCGGDNKLVCHEVTFGVTNLR